MTGTFKVVKVRIRRGGLGEDLMVYPDHYDAQEVDRRGIGPLNLMAATGAYSGHIGLGGDEEWCLIALPVDLAAQYAKDANMEIVTVQQADALMEEWRQLNGATEEIVSSPIRLEAIRAKREAGLTLSEEDLAALDPEDMTPGINRRLYPLARFYARRGIMFE